MLSSITIKNPFKFTPPPPPPSACERMWTALTSSPRVNKVALSVADHLTNYAVKKVIANSDNLRVGADILFNHLVCSGLPAREVAEVSEVILLAIRAGLR